MWNLFYRNPRLLVVAICLIIVAGLSAYSAMPRMEDPLLTDRFAVVNTVFPGAGAERLESQITEHLEEALSEVPEIKELRSSSRAGISTIIIELQDEVYSSEFVWARIRDKLDDAALLFPEGVRDPEFEIINIRGYALITALTWRRENPPNYAILRRLAEQLEEELSALPGTEEAEAFGEPAEEILVEVDAAKLASLGLTAADVSRQIHASDAKRPAGLLRSPTDNLLLEVDGEFDSLTRIARTPIRHGKFGASVPLADVATIRKGIAEPPESLVFIDDRFAVAVAARVRCNHRIDLWSQAADEVIARFRQQLPPGLGIDVVFEQNHYVVSRLHKLLGNLLVGALAVVLVVFGLMGWRSAVIVASALLLSTMMVLTGLHILEIPIHQMSVTGLIIALGLLIDNAIIVVDEVEGKLRDGYSPSEAISASVRYLALPLFGSTLTTALAFAPVFLASGPAGEFAGSIAVSVVLAVGSSLLLALTVVPTLVVFGRRFSRQLRTEPWWGRGLGSARLTAAYRATLDVIFRRPWIGVAAGVAIPVFGFIQWRHLPEQFFPPADRDQIQIEMELPAHVSMSETLSAVREVDRIAKRDSRILKLNWFLGESAPSFYYNVIGQRKNNANYAQALVQLDAANGAQDLVHDLHAQLAEELPGVRLLVRQLEQGPPFDAPIEVRLFGPDIEELIALGEHVRVVLTQTPHIIHTRCELSESLPKLALQVDEEEARLADLTREEVATQLQSILDGRVGGSLLEETEELPVRVRLSNRQRARLADIASLELLPVGRPSSERTHVPLSAMAQIRLRSERASIPHYNRRRMNEVEGFIPAGMLPANVLSDFQQRLDESGFSLPPGYSLEIGGEAAERNESIGKLLSNIDVLLVLMLATLVLALRSFRGAAIIGMVGLLSVGSGLGALWLFGFPFGFMAIVGTMGLVGVAVNDSIVVMAALRTDEQARRGDRTATREVVVRSTRHVVATSLTTMAGFTPLVLSGGGFWPPLATAIAGGVAGATALALYFVPSAHLMIMCLRGNVQQTLPDHAAPDLADDESEFVDACRDLLDWRAELPSVSASRSIDDDALAAVEDRSP